MLVVFVVGVKLAAVVVVYAHDCTGESENLAESGQYGWVYLAGGRNNESGDYHPASEYCHEYCKDKLLHVFSSGKWKVES